MTKNSRDTGCFMPLRRGFPARITGLCLLISCLVLPTLAQEADMKVMDGVPPNRESQVTFKNYRTSPFSQWSFSNVASILNVLMIPRAGGLQEFEQNLDSRIANFQTDGGTLEEVLKANYTDGFLVLKGNELRYETYYNALAANRQHIWFSATKSLTSIALGILVEEGKINLSDSPAKYIPELTGSGFERTTVQQVLNHCSGIDFKENYADLDSDFIKHYGPANNMAFVPGARDAQPENTPIYGVADFLSSYIKPDPKLKPGEAFDYNSANADVAGWLIARVSGQTWDHFVQERIWSKLGTEHDAYVACDRAGVAVATGGMNTTLRDAARFGSMIRNRGQFGGRQVVPAAWIDETVKVSDGDRARMRANPTYEEAPWEAYRNMWWVLDSKIGEYAAVGIHGQVIYINQKQDLVICMFSSHPVASNAASPHFSKKLDSIRKLAASDLLSQ
jgi:CubicO group peptidase (beta-lactamase class C family)